MVSDGVLLTSSYNNSTLGKSAYGVDCLEEAVCVDQEVLGKVDCLYDNRAERVECR